MAYMKDDSSRLVENKLTEIVNVTILKDILNAFTTATNLMGNIVDTKGKSIFSSKDVEKCCEFCKVIYRTESGVKRCQSAYERAGKQAVNFSGPYIFRCPAGLLELAAPIIIEGEHLGTIICGPVSYTHLDVYKRQQQHGDPGPPAASRAAAGKICAQGGGDAREQGDGVHDLSLTVQR